MAASAGRRRKKGEKEVARFPGVAVGSASALESYGFLARYRLSFRNDFAYLVTETILRAKGSAP